MNEMYVSETEGFKMIVDIGAPLSIVSNKWLEKYIDEMKVDREDIEKRSCNIW